MVASTIAYLLTAIFVVLGAGILFFAWYIAVPELERKGFSFASMFYAGIGFIALAWLCAHLGGI
jgi:hypothetical protein